MILLLTFCQATAGPKSTTITHDKREECQSYCKNQRVLILPKLKCPPHTTVAVSLAISVAASGHLFIANTVRDFTYWIIL